MPGIVLYYSGVDVGGPIGGGAGRGPGSRREGQLPEPGQDDHLSALQDHGHARDGQTGTCRYSLRTGKDIGDKSWSHRPPLNKRNCFRLTAQLRIKGPTNFFYGF